MLYKFPSWVRSSRNQDGAVVLDIRSNRIFNFNHAGSELLEMLRSGPTSSAALSEALVERYAIGTEAADRDVAEFLAQLNAHRLIENA
jgi:hypothetical protein